ncbi:MAG: CocE/NonD family hydrolase [Gemmatimonadetes bacterium]|nr:CocE/NonD family hydrolase [Gemmatimonadota bacterium]
MFPTRHLLALAIVAAAACQKAPNDTAANDSATGNRMSRFGEYRGYSDSLYSEWVRESRYIAMRDGVKIAVDIVRPAVNGVAVDRKFPVLWTHSRYHRGAAPPAAFEISRNLAAPTPGPWPLDSIPRDVPSQVDRNRALQRLVTHGYVVVAAQVRGGGASYGRYEGLFSPAETRDAYDLMEWMSKEPWSDGNLGMFGGSYLGITQYMAASTKHPALKAIFPNVAAFDMYDVFHDGGIYRQNMIEHWGRLTRALDVWFPEPPVDQDETGAMWREALGQHKDNWTVQSEFKAAAFRDHKTPSFDQIQFQPSTYLSEMNQSGVAAHHFGGWYDIFARDEMQWLVNWHGPDRVTMGPWAHASPDSAMGVEQARIISAEQHRWFDRWLKGIQNGVDRDPPVNYALMIDPGRWTWEHADAWPLKTVSNVDYFFAAGPSGSVQSVNDGTLAAAGGGDAGTDRWLVDLTTTTGTASRWDNAVGQGPMRYPDMTANDAKSLTYTTARLASDVTVIGHPVVTLYLSSDQRDGDFYAYLEEVDSTGFSRYVSEGMLRASRRAQAQAPWDNLGLPWEMHDRASAKPLVPGEVVELTFDLQPTATVFNAGHRIRVTIAGADVDNTEKPPVRGRPTVTLHRGGERASRIALPIR